MSGTRRWRWRTAPFTGAATIAVELDLDGHRANFAEVLAAWRHDDGFRRDWSRWLADIPLPSYCWEMPPLTTALLARPFECVVVESPSLAIPVADPEPFAAYFPDSAAQQDVVTFRNLGGDALLVVPTPQSDPANYPHLARFLRNAPAQQAASIWEAVAAAVAHRLGTEPLWLSTAGLGVAWLHVRIDSSPKYYRHRPYIRFPQN